MDSDIVALEARLEKLLEQQKRLQEQLGVHRHAETASARKRDRPWAFSARRAVEARAKRGDRARLDRVNRQIEQTRLALSKHLDAF